MVRSASRIPTHRRESRLENWTKSGQVGTLTLLTKMKSICHLDQIFITCGSSFLLSFALGPEWDLILLIIGIISIMVGMFCSIIKYLKVTK